MDMPQYLSMIVSLIILYSAIKVTFNFNLLQSLDLSNISLVYSSFFFGKVECFRQLNFLSLALILS